MQNYPEIISHLSCGQISTLIERIKADRKIFIVSLLTWRGYEITRFSYLKHSEVITI